MGLRAKYIPLVWSISIKVFKIVNYVLSSLNSVLLEYIVPSLQGLCEDCDALGQHGDDDNFVWGLWRSCKHNVIKIDLLKNLK